MPFAFTLQNTYVLAALQMPHDFCKGPGFLSWRGRTPIGWRLASPGARESSSWNLVRLRLTRAARRSKNGILAVFTGDWVRAGGVGRPSRFGRESPIPGRYFGAVVCVAGGMGCCTNPLARE